VTDNPTSLAAGNERAFRLEDFDPALAEAVRAGLDRVERLLHESLASEVRLLSDTAVHLVDAGGKRFRPLFALLASQFGDPERREVTISAAAVELVHLATLYHDDVMDEATIRRGAVSVNARWDNTIAILTGDYLFAHASRLVADLGTDAARIIAETFSELVTGQMKETIGPAAGQDPVAHYLSVLSQKTGSLMATAGRYGGMCSLAEQHHVEALRQYGELIGTAYQISDDIIDIASPETDSGKTPGTDLREGVCTLPMLYALTEDGADGTRLRELLGTPLEADEQVDEALSLLRASNALRRAGETLRDYADGARATLRDLPDSPARDALRSLTDYVVARTG
jgi:heptaprenyl diphosphate synthase